MRIPILSLAILLAACTVKNPNYVPALEGGAPADLSSDQPAFDGAVPDVRVPRPDGPLPQKPKGVDVLIVVDDSPGMPYSQAWLARDIEALTSALDALPGGWRIGVVTTDLGVGAYANSNCSQSGDGGKLILRPGCPVPAGGVKYVQRVGGVLNVPGTAKDALGCMVQLGEEGCGFEQPLEAMRAALGVNPSFLRPDAALAVLFLTNEDDCSAKSVGLYNPNDTALGPYSSFRCFQKGVLCNGQEPPLEATLLQGCKPGGTWLWEVKSRYVDFLRGLKPQSWLSVLVLAAQPLKTVQVSEETYRSQTYYSVEPACTTAAFTGDPAFRLQELVDHFATQGLFSSICAASYVPALQGLVTRIKSSF